MRFIKNLALIILILFFLNSCAVLPGINDGPSKKVIKKNLESEYSIDDIGIEIIEITKLTENDFKIFNKTEISEINFKINEFDDIYNFLKKIK